MSFRPSFSFEVEAEVFEKAGAPQGQRRRIGGICTTDRIDKQGEVLLQEGLDFKPFLKGGWFNDNHADETPGAVGYPSMAELRTLPGGRKGWYVEGFLLEDYEPADKLWNLAKSLQKTDRRLGFSVEGAILERDATNKKIVRKAIVKEVAITRCPVSDDTALEVLAKSLSATTSKGKGRGTSVEPALLGYALTALSPSGAALQPEALEGARKKLSRAMSKAEVKRVLRNLYPALDDAWADLVADHAVTHYPAAKKE